MAQYEDTRDLVAALEPSSRLAAEPTIEEPRLVGSRVHPIFISERVMPWWSRVRDKFLWETLLSPLLDTHFHHAQRQREPP
jgi:hypothetical protein